MTLVEEIPSTSSNFRGSYHSHFAQLFRDPSSTSMKHYSDSDHEDEVSNPSKKDDPNAVCIFYYESHSSNRPGEEWVQCCMCENWIHTACMDSETDFYACDYCKDLELVKKIEINFVHFSLKIVFFFRLFRKIA